MCAGGGWDERGGTSRGWYDDMDERRKRERERYWRREEAKRKRVRKEDSLVVDHALGPRLMKLSVEDVYR